MRAKEQVHVIAHDRECDDVDGSELCKECEALLQPPASFRIVNE
jgi:hypothetical protein